MTDNLQNFHHQVSVSAHNQAMDILYSDEPTHEEVESLIELTHVAYWHWRHREDRQPQNISVALWAISRAYSANGMGAIALRYALESLATIEKEDLLPSFYGYCNEALSRAYALTGDMERARHHLNLAYEIAEAVPNEQAKKYLLGQIDRIEL
ncbi:MAG: hypothetical protein HUJ31_19660 [Pseudomonadales bacterium]|nr:hypothetical protein [Pseudomonadales bacterium]